MVGGNLGLGLNDNIVWIPEDNWSIVSKSTDIWNGELPYKQGMQFPTKEIEDRATISHTNKMVYENRIDEIYTNIISIFPEIDPMYGWQIREIITSLPYFKNSTDAWVGLVAGDTPFVDINDDADNDDIEMKLSEIIENSNFTETIQNEVRSRFIDVIGAYRVDVGLDGKPTIVAIESKNLICFVNKDIPTSIEVNVVFSIYKGEDGNEYIDFVEYHYDGFIRKHTFYYSNGCIGEYASEIEEDRAFNGKFDSSPIVVFKHNVNGNEIYGTDQYRYWYPSMLAGMRTLQNILRLSERTREMIRKVPNSAIKKSSVDGSSVFFNKGTIGYNEGNDKSPDMEYVVPEIRMDEAVKALDNAVKQISMDTQLGIAFFNIEMLGSRLSADSIRASMYPARLQAKRMTTEMKPNVKELIVKMGYIVDLDINVSKLSVDFYDGFPKDEMDDIKSIQLRLESNRPSITLEDAIMKLDRVTLRVAREKAEQIRRENTGYNEETDTSISLDDSNIEDDKDKNNDIDELNVNGHGISPTAGVTGTSSGGMYVDDTVWDNQMIPVPRDISLGSKE